MNIFQKAKTMLANLAKNIVNKTADRSRVLAGKALVNHNDRRMTPPEWIRWYLNGNKVPLAHPGAPYVNRGYARRATTTRTVPRVNYRKQVNRVARALKQFNGEPAKLWPGIGNHAARMSRDALTGIVS